MPPSTLLVALAFAPLLWGLAWSLRYLPVPIKNPAVRLIALVIGATAMLAILTAQVLVYRSMTGVQAVGNDPIFMPLTILQNIVFILFVVSSARDRQKRTQSTTQQP